MLISHRVTNRGCVVYIGSRAASLVVRDFVLRILLRIERESMVLSLPLESKWRGCESHVARYAIGIGILELFGRMRSGASCPDARGRAASASVCLGNPQWLSTRRIQGSQWFISRRQAGWFLRRHVPSCSCRFGSRLCASATDDSRPACRLGTRVTCYGCTLCDGSAGCAQPVATFPTAGRRAP